MLLIDSRANSSWQPGCTPASTVIGLPGVESAGPPSAREALREIELAVGDHPGIGVAGLDGHVADVGEALGAQQLLGDVESARRRCARSP